MIQNQRTLLRDVQEERRRQVEFEEKDGRRNFWVGLWMGCSIGSFLVFFLLLLIGAL